MNRAPDDNTHAPDDLPLARDGWSYHHDTFAGPDQRAPTGPSPTCGPVIAEIDVVIAEDLTLSGHVLRVDALLATGPDDPRLMTLIDQVVDRLDHADLAEGYLECEIYERYLAHRTDGDDEIAFFEVPVSTVLARLAEHDAEDGHDRELVPLEEFLAELGIDPADLAGGPDPASGPPASAS